MNTARYGRYKKIVNGISICVFILAAITNYSLKKYGDLKLFPERMYYLAFFVQPLLLVFLGAVMVPLTGLSRLRWSRRWCGYLSIFLFLFALGGSLCMLLCLAAFPEGGILSRIGFRLYSTHKNWLVALGLSWALSINIYLGRNAE